MKLLLPEGQWTMHVPGGSPGVGRESVSEIAVFIGKRQDARD
jgi:hypothetical protein